MPEQLLAAVHELTDVVKKLQRTLEKDYPKRSEIERRFVSEQDSKRRRNNFIFLVVLSIFFSYFVTVSTISTCFLGGAQNGHPPEVCSVLPGYDEAQARNKRIIDQFTRMLDVMESNQQRIERLEKQVH